MLPLELPLTPMLARLGDRLPAGMAYEPKWDGWRALLARDGDDVRLWSRHGRDLTAYFPDLVKAAADLPEQCVLDGEIVIISGRALDYTKLANRHSTPAKATALAAEWPASFVAFDLLALGETALLDQPWRIRRELLEAVVGDLGGALLLSPETRDESVAADWFQRFEGAGLDGVVAKPVEGRYLPGQRAMIKVKHRRTADVVVAGYRLDRTSSPSHPQLGSLLLGLHDDAGVLHAVGICAGFPSALRGQLAETFAELELPRGSAEWAEHPWAPGPAERTKARTPEHVTRWSQPRDEAHLTWPLLVAEVRYDALHDEVRFRSNTDFLRFRPDRTPESCRFDQLEVVVRYDLRGMFSG